MDKKSVDLADKIMKNSDVNLESEKYPHSGLIYSIQMLRLEGLSDNEILDVAKDTRLADLVYQLYETEPRRISGANELYEILANFADDNNIEFAETEGEDTALRTYYHQISPSELTGFLIEYLRTGEEEDLGY